MFSMFWKNNSKCIIEMFNLYLKKINMHTNRRYHDFFQMTTLEESPSGTCRHNWWNSLHKWSHKGPVWGLLQTQPSRQCVREVFATSSSCHDRILKLHGLPGTTCTHTTNNKLLVVCTSSGKPLVNIWTQKIGHILFTQFIHTFK